jgi:hypothetical protein
VLSIPVSSLFLWKSIWKVKAHSRVAFFVWTALGKILTLDNLRKRNIIVVDWCYMCKKSGESIDHFFIVKLQENYGVCLFIFLMLLGFMTRKMRELLVSWRGQMGNHNALEVWWLAPLYLNVVYLE